MDLAVALLLAISASITTGVFVRERARIRVNPDYLMLPPPGPNLELFTRVNDLLDDAAAERDEARTESARLKADLEDMTSMRDLAEAKLRSANDLLRGFTHAKMEIKPHGELVTVRRHRRVGLIM